MRTVSGGLGFVALGALLVACSANSTVVLPETRISVVDEAGRPVGGVPLWYGVESEVYRPPILGVLPRIDGYIGPRFILKETVATPANGEVVFPRRVLELGKHEHFRYEHIYVNAAVDSTSSVARAAREVMEGVCGQRDPLCPGDGTVQAIDIAKQVWLSPAGRAGALQPADGSYRVVRVLVVGPERQKDFEQREADSVFVSRAVGSDRSMPETIRIELPGK